MAGAERVRGGDAHGVSSLHRSGQPAVCEHKGEGFENRIAELFASKLGLPVKNYAFPQRMNFIRNTLRYKLPGEDFRCDIVMSVPAGYDQASATAPYYRSTYALVYPKGKGLDQVRSGADLFALPAELRSKLTIGIYDKSPASTWLVKHGMEAQAKPYQMLSPDPDAVSRANHRQGARAGQDRRRDRVGSDRRLLRQARAKRRARRRFRFDRSPASSSTMRSRWACATANANGRRPCEKLIAQNKAAITAILREYGVPLLDEQGQPIN